MTVKGFRASAVAAGLRYQERLDLGLIAADEPAAAAGMLTRNRVKAAPVLWSEGALAAGRIRAILVNAGRANACTGAEGMETAARSARAVAAVLGCDPGQVLLASTGIIGQQLNIEVLEKAVPDLAAGLGEDGLPRVAEAMMTTDTHPKTARAQGEILGRPFQVVGLAKGSGMICPDMATMLSFVLTDAAVEPGMLKTMLGRAVDQTYNCITVDGDTSTNDCVFLLASGRAGNEPIREPDSPGREAFEAALCAVLADLAEMMIADGEGATKLVRIRVEGARDPVQAKNAAMTVANSPLVKTAFFGQDANWGRILAALGRSGAEFDPDRVDIDLDGAPLVRGGRGLPDEAPAAAVMRQERFAITIDLKNGQGRAEVLTCDLSLDYVKINADYRS
ncbi:MAG: bifunctional glutamate N-acetyltransferase/amino-acid acetyltransferase ArgJ [Proteobacteria bacterium]|nr:bifunctional glutamate N-acetyltransferase/amino-acid acetyltransferase ArgJ [Pseudomonadota bacterium]